MWFYKTKIVYEIPVAVNKVSLLARTIGTSDNATVTINKSGLLDAVNALEKAGVVNFLAAQAGATATEIGRASCRERV